MKYIIQYRKPKVKKWRELKKTNFEQFLYGRLLELVGMKHTKIC